MYDEDLLGLIRNLPGSIELPAASRRLTAIRPMFAPLLLALTSVFVGPETPLTGAPLATQSDPVITFVGHMPVVVWRETTVRSGVFPGKPIADSDESTLRESSDVAGLAAASSGDQSLIVWLEGSHVSGIRVGGDGRPLAPAAAIAPSDGARLVAVAASTDRYLVIWVNESNAIVARMIGPDGQALTSPVVINSPADRVLSIAAATNGTDFLVVWSTGHVQALAVSSQGVPRMTNAIAIDAQESGNSSVVAWNGREYLVAWSSAGLRAQRLLADGSPLGDVIRISGSDSLLGDMALTLVWDGSSFVLASLRFLGYRDPNFLSYVTAIRLTAEGLPAEQLLTSESVAVVTRPSDYAVAAHDGHLILAYAFGSIAVRTTELGTPMVLRARAVRP